jgi:FixJ family two-component response regulator
LVVDDDASVREALASLIGSAGLLVECFASPAEFLRRRRHEAPSCLVLDVRMPGMSGLDLQHRLAHAEHRIPIIFITAHGDIPMTSKAMKAGAIEFLAKPFPKEDLLAAIHRGLQLDETNRAHYSELVSLQSRFEQLSPREKEVMNLVVTGIINKQIAGQLGISEVTVKIHRRQVMEKMNAESLADLVRMSDKLKIQMQK